MTAPLTAGRRSVLAVGLPFCAVVIGYGVLSLANVMGLTSFSESRTVVPLAKQVTVSADAGYLHVQPSSDGKVHIRFSGHYSLQKPSLSVTSTSAGVKIKGTCPNLIDTICGEDLTVDLPADFTVTARSGGGTVRASGLTGRLTMHSSAGDVSGDGLRSAEVTASSSAGDVDLTFTAVPDRVTSSSSAGDVDVTLPGSGSYRVTADDQDGATVTVPQSSTSSHVVIATSSAGDVTVETG